jgi:uncharacterized SAM-binding protein YcdF (DUF218 family)
MLAKSERSEQSGLGVAIRLDDLGLSERTYAHETSSTGTASKVADLLGSGERVAMIIFGKKLQRDGTLDSRGLETMAAVASIYNDISAIAEKNVQNLAVIFSGGRSSSYVIRGLDLPTEASVMKRDLESRGVRPENAILEEDSCDTVGNVILSYPLVKSFGATAVLLIAEKPMMDRTMKIAKRVFGESVTMMEETAEVKLSPQYVLYNRVKEKLAFLILFERNFNGVEANDIEEFTKRLKSTSLYRRG